MQRLAAEACCAAAGAPRRGPAAAASGPARQEGSGEPLPRLESESGARSALIAYSQCYAHCQG